jgi:hypothetical protein
MKIIQEITRSVMSLLDSLTNPLSSEEYAEVIDILLGDLQARQDCINEEMQQDENEN